MDIGSYFAGFFPPGPERDMLASTVFQIRCTEYDLPLISQEMAGR